MSDLAFGKFILSPDSIVQSPQADQVYCTLHWQGLLAYCFLVKDGGNQMRKVCSQKPGTRINYTLKKKKEKKDKHMFLVGISFVKIFGH